MHRMRGLTQLTGVRLGYVDTQVYDDGSSYSWETETGNPVSYSVIPASNVSNVNTESSWNVNQIIDSVARAGTTIASVYNQQQINELNMERIRRGQPPLSIAQMNALRPSLNFGMTDDVKNMLMIGGLGLLAVFALSRAK